MLMLFPNMSISVGQIHTFKTNAIADLIIQSISCHENQVISQVQCGFQRLRNLHTFQKFLNYSSSLTTLYLTPYPTHLPPNLVVSGRESFSGKPYLRVPLLTFKCYFHCQYLMQTLKILSCWLEKNRHPFSFLTMHFSI